MIGRLEQKHWALIVGFLTSTGTMLGGWTHWSDITPLTVAGLLGQLGVLIGAVFAGAPPNPKWKHGGHPHRRHNERRVDRGSVSESTRANLP